MIQYFYVNYSSNSLYSVWGGRGGFPNRLIFIVFCYNPERGPTMKNYQTTEENSIHIVTL